MSTGNSLGLFIKGIADALREAIGTVEKISPMDFANLIRELQFMDGSFHATNKLMGQSPLDIGDSYQYTFAHGDPNFCVLFSIASSEVFSVFTPVPYQNDQLFIPEASQQLIPGNAINTTSVNITDQGLLTVSADTSRHSTITKETIIFILFIHITDEGVYDLDFDLVQVPIRLSYLSSFDVVRNSNKQSNYTVEDTDDGYLQITFNGPTDPSDDDATNADGFYFRNYSYTSNTTYYDLYVDDYQVIRPSNLTDANWGFYNGSSGGLFSSGSYTMVSKDELRTSDAFLGMAQRGSVQFNVGSSYRGRFPLTIKMRANITYV